MPRPIKILLTLAALGLVTYFLVSLYLPSSRWLVFGVDKHSGAVRAVESRVSFLPPNQFYRLKFEKREGWAQNDGRIRIDSKEGVPVTMQYRLRFGIAGERLPDAQKMVNDGWNAWIRARVSEAVSAVTQQVPIEDLLSPTSQFNTQRDPLRRTVTAHLAQSGLKVTAFEIAKFDVDRDALLRVKRAELRRDARSAPGRVAIFALDGADWELLSELMNDDRLPNLKALAQGGATASVASIQPMVSPMLWTTVATGLTPDRHGVLDFVDPASHQPVNATSRRAPALWEIADSFGRSALVANWWTDWPPSPHDGDVVFDTPGELVPNAISPADAAQRAGSLVVPVDTVGYAQVRRFLNITPAEFDKAVSSGAPSDPINAFRGVLAKTWSDHRVAINLYNDARRNNRDPLLVMMAYDGTDAVNHLFSPFHPPYRDGISQDGYRKFWPAVANYYSEVDRLLGEWMGTLAPDTNVIVVSAHGFRWGKNRPHSVPNGGAMLSDHRSPGIFIAYGQRVAASRGNHAMSIFDVAPTALALLGLPKSTDMPGNLVPWGFKDVAPLQSVRVVSYSEFVNFRPQPSPVGIEAKPYELNLQAIGHLYDPTRNLTPLLDEDQPAAQPLPPERWGLYAYYNNLGVQLREKGKIVDAADAFDRAIDINPGRPTPYLNKAMALFDKQFYSDADEAFQTAVAKGLPNPEQWFLDFAALYRQHDMPSRAIALLYKGKQMFPQSYPIAANLGSALVAASRYTEGLPELERALGMMPSSTMVLNNLGIFYAKKHDYGRALDYWNRSLSIDARQPQIRQAAEAARSML